MRAVRLHAVGQLRVEDVATSSSPPPGHLLLRVRAAGICGSDLHNFRTGRWLSKVPVIPGHEFAGEVVEVGEGVSTYRQGDLVVADSRVPCGTCGACRQGLENVCARLGYVGEVCDGGFAEFVMLPAGRVLRVPSGVPPRIAALSEPLGVALHLIRRLDPVPGQPILIAGAGPVGGLAAIALDHLGFGPLFILERNEARANLVATLANATLCFPMPKITAAAPDGLRYAIEATGAAALLSLLGQAMTGRGRLALVGLFHGQCLLDCNAIIEKEITLLGCSVFQDEQACALELLSGLRAKLDRVISEPLPLEQVPAEYERLLAGESPVLKSIVYP